MSVVADPSRRFVVGEDAPYVRNLGALWGVDPGLAAAVEGVVDGEMYGVEGAKDGNWTVAVSQKSPHPGPLPEYRERGKEGEDGERRTSNIERPTSKVYLHSRYRPVEEAGKLVEGVGVEGKYVFFVHGLGLGYHVEKLLGRVSSEAVVVCFEPDVALVKTALWHRDFSEAIEARRLVIVAGGDKAALFNRLSGKMALVLDGWEVVRHPASVQLHPGFHEEVARWCEEFAAYARTSVNTLLINGRRTAENIARNVGWYTAAGSVDRLKDRYKGKPAVIVSAGPSLRKNKHLLKGLEDKAVIIAVQTTLQPLLEMGVEPHFVTSLDYHEISARFFEKLPKGLRTELVAEPKAAKVVLGLHPGPVTLLGNDYAERLLREMKVNKGTLRSGATVAHLAFYLAEHLGCDPVIFLGQDLGFSDGLCYAPGTSYEDVWRCEMGRFCTVEMKQWEQIVRERHILRRVEDHEGRPTYTEERLYTYLQQFERDFLQTTTKVIDATEGGVRKRGAVSMGFAEAIEKYVGGKSEIRSTKSETNSNGEKGEKGRAVERLTDHPGGDWSKGEGCRESLRKRREEAGEIGEIAEKTLPLLAEIGENLSDQGRVNRAIARIDELRKRMNDLGQTYDLIMQLTQTTELARFKRDRAIAAAKVKGADRQKRQVMRDVENVKAVREAAREFVGLMDAVLGEME